jgi:tetraacyldisaccharide 4'-kinase
MFLKILLSPVSVIYKWITSFRNTLYNKGIFKSTAFGLPVISIGNLTVGGTGKTPHTEYLIRLLKDKYSVVTLSRGYGRKTKGFQVAEPHSNSTHIGDEPSQYYTKFRDIKVCVGENRVQAVQKLLEQFPETEVILLDDAFQHRAIKPGLSILLTEYNRLFIENYLLPLGTLRESASGMKRADIIIITKTPTILSPIERRRIESSIRPLPHQKIYYSYIKYGEFVPAWDPKKPLLINKEFYFERHYCVLLVAGIANPDPVYIYLKDSGAKVSLMKFPDHHEYTLADTEKIKKAFEDLRGNNKIILTTEKDYMRFKKPELEGFLNEMKIFYLPIEVAFHDRDAQQFNNRILSFVKTFYPDRH